MTNDELLSGFLDRSLSEDSLLEFEARQQASPAFAREVQEMLAVETALATVTPIAAIPTGFLQRVEDAVAGKVATGASASTGILGGLSTTWTWVGTAALVALGTAATVYLTSPSHDESHDSVALPSVARSETSVARPSVALPSVARSETSVARPSVARPSVARPSVARPSVALPSFLHSDSREAQLDINNQSSVIASLRKDLDRCMAQNNRMECALIARTLGAKLRTGGSFDESRVYLQQSLDIARSMHLVQYEVGALGELGLLARDRGNTAEARTLLQQAITKAASVDAASAAQYEKALTDLGQ